VPLSLAETLAIKQGNVFLTSPRDGDMPADEPHSHGLWYRDCRFLSAHELRVNGEAPVLLQASDAAGDRALHDLTDSQQSLSLRLEREVSARGLLCERISVANHRNEPLALELELRLGADFEPMLALRGIVERTARPQIEAELAGTELRFSVRGRDDVTRTTAVQPSTAPVDSTLVPGPAAVARLRFEAEVPAEGVYELLLEITISEGDARGAPTPPAPHELMRVRSDEELFDRVLARSLADLELLRSELDGHSYYAAGVPWYVTLFGRDALISGMQMLAFAPEVAADTLRLLGGLQGRDLDEARAEQPGRILHELRVGEPAALGETPFARYYGTADATPLWLCLLVDHSDWSGNLDLFGELRPQVDAALEWMERDGDPDGDGLIEYSSGPAAGLANQGWRDSWDGVPNDAGAPLTAPIALVEVQGYAIRALRGTARLLELDGDGSRAEGLRDRADRIALALESFWVPGVGSYAIGLDGLKRPGSGLTSNPGHLLWARALPPERARCVRDALMGGALFSGWGVRTLAEGEGRYNPIGYHVGTVWPFDNSFIAWGLRRYGFKKEAAQVAAGILNAASFFQGRLPEAFAGYTSKVTNHPVEYPTACSPQAWSTGTPLLLLRTMLGLEPIGDQLVVDPALPSGLGVLALLDIPGRWGRVDAFARGQIDLSRRQELDPQLGPPA
jgi:glycogen debranching enzyme